MKIKTLVIGLLTDRIDVVLCSGTQIVDGRRIRVPLEQDAVKWPRQVRDAAKAVAEAAADMSARGLPARVLYRGPTSVAEYVAPRVKTPREAASAGILACADSLSCPLDVAAAQAVVVGFDKGEQARSHVIVAADGDDALTAISEMVSEAELTFLSATPIDAVLMASVSQKLSQSEDGCVATLYMGEHRSFLAVAVNQTLTFARPISVGLEALINSLRLPLRMRSGQTLELSLDKAREIIHDCGFPSRSQVVDAQLELTGGQIIPLLQPALQRCMVEVRQSLRFALPENQRHTVKLTLCGPGARTPGFMQIAADELGLKVAVDERARGYDHREPASPASELADAVSERRLVGDLSLEPLAVTRRRRQRAMQRWLWTGAAAALAMIAFDAARFHGRLSQVRDQVEALETQNEGLRALKATADRLLASAAAMNTVENVIRRETGAHVYMGAAMQELSRLTPPSIRLSSVSFKPGSDTINGVLSGYALDDPSAPGSATRVLESYMQQLGQSPLLSQLVLSNVQVTAVRDQPAQTFEMEFVSVPSPVEVASSAGASTVADAKDSVSASAATGETTP